MGPAGPIGQVAQGGTLLTPRGVLNFKGGLLAADNGATSSTDVDMAPLSPPWGIAQTIANRDLERISVMDNLSSAERSDALSYAATIDVTAKVQAINDYLVNKSTAGGAGNAGVIEVPACRLQINNLKLGKGVYLVAQGWRGQLPQTYGGAAPYPPYQLKSTQPGSWIVDSVSGVSNSGVVGLTLLGTGGTSSGGVRHQNAARCCVIGCFISTMQDWAILQTSGVACLYEDNLVYNCLLDRLRTVDQTTLPHGVIEIRGFDTWVRGGEYNASSTGVFGAPVVTGTCQAGSTGTTVVLAATEPATDAFYNGYLIELTGGLGAGQISYISSYVGASKTATLLAGCSWYQAPDATSTYKLTPLRCFAGAFKGSDAWVTGGMYELSEGGIYVNANTSVPPCKFSATVADQNSGPGWLIVNSASIDTSCAASRNSKAVDGAYDDYLIISPGSGVTLTKPRGGGLGSDANQPRHYIHAALSPTGADANRAVIDIGQPGGARRGKIVKVEQNGVFAHAPRVSLPDGTLILTTGTTPSVDGFRKIVLNYGSATTITAFTDIVEGETYSITSWNANATLQNGTTIKNALGCDLVLSPTGNATTAVEYYCFNGNLIQLQTAQRVQPVTTIVYSASMTPDVSKGYLQQFTISDAVAFTINAPINLPTPTNAITLELMFEAYNNSGGAAGAATWNAAFVFATGAWANPATGKKRFAKFQWNVGGAKWVCTSLATADY
jgi:hypothetical protein